jgi:hypothetical protein
MILGMSIAGLLELQCNAMEYLKAFSQLLHEYEYHSTHEPGSLSAKPKMVFTDHSGTNPSETFSNLSKVRQPVDRRVTSICTSRQKALRIRPVIPI